MAIRALSLQECDRFNSARSTLARHIEKAVEWFTDDAGDVLGAIAYHQRDLEWSLVVVGRDNHGTFHALERDAGLRALDDARRLVVAKMARVSGAADLLVVRAHTDLATRPPGVFISQPPVASEDDCVYGDELHRRRLRRSTSSL